MAEDESKSVPKLCRHRFRVDGWLPCPFCKPEETAVLRGEGPLTEEERQLVIVKSKSMRAHELQHQGSRRALHLEGQTLAGCFAIRIAAAATANTRFLWRMSCGHEEIRDGTELRSAEKAGQTLECKACAKASTRAVQSEKARVRNARKVVT